MCRLSDHLRLSWGNFSGIMGKPKMVVRGFPGGSEVKKPPANAGDTGLISDPGISHRPRGSKPMRHNY